MVGIICLLITVIILIVGLWPFDFNPINNVEWVQNGSGIRFYGQGIAFTTDPLLIQRTISRNAAVTIEFVVRPQKESINMVASILTLYHGDRDQFIFGQWKKELIIRIPAATSILQKRYREIEVEKVLAKDTTHLIAVTSSEQITDIYIDGNLVKSVQHFSLIPDDQRLVGRLVLGNSPEGTNPWDGTLIGLVIYAGTLEREKLHDHFTSWQQGRSQFLTRKGKPLALYLFDENNSKEIYDHSSARNDLQIPAIFHPLRRIILGLPERDQWFRPWNLMDIMINVLGFVPFGFILFAWLRQGKILSAQTAYSLSILLGFCLSLAIELAQAYIPPRDSSLMDVFSNTIGIAVGAILINYAFPILRRINGVPKFDL